MVYCACHPDRELTWYAAALTAVNCMDRVIDCRVSGSLKQLYLCYSCLELESTQWLVSYTNGNSIVVLNGKKKPELNGSSICSFCHQCQYRLLHVYFMIYPLLIQ